MAVISLGKRQKLLKRVDKSMCCMQQTDAPMQQICQSFVARHAHAPRHPLAHFHTQIHRDYLQLSFVWLQAEAEAEAQAEAKLKRRLPRNTKDKPSRRNYLALSLSHCYFPASVSVSITVCYAADMLIKTMP